MRGFFFMPADGVALRFLDVVDCEGSRNSRKQSNMEVAWVSVEKACISFHQTTAWCVHPPTMDIELRKLIPSQLDIFVLIRPFYRHLSQSKLPPTPQLLHT
jgi:hypothetical protein